MNDAPPLITLQDVRDTAERITTEHPDRLNPIKVNGSNISCRYTDDEDPTLHCLGGHVLLELGCIMPREGRTVMDSPSCRRFEGWDGAAHPGQAMNYLRRLQSMADRGGPQREDPTDSVVYIHDRRLEWRLAYDQAEEWLA